MRILVPMRILIVEDDLTTLSMMNGILEDYGVCDTAEDGEQGMRAFESALNKGQPYDLICLDIMMPKVDGQKMLKQIRAKEETLGIQAGQEVKVIMTTGMDASGHLYKAYKGGCTSYLIKPVESKQLIGLLKAFGLMNKVGS